MDFVKANSDKEDFVNAVRINEADIKVVNGCIKNHKQIIEFVRRSGVDGVIVKDEEKKSKEKILVENSDQTQHEIPLDQFKETLEEFSGL